MKDYGRGCNQIKMAQSRLYQPLAKYGSGTNVATAAAEDYVHYIHGVNPFGFVYVTNMKRAGAENSATTLYRRRRGREVGHLDANHTWLVRSFARHIHKPIQGWSYGGEASSVHAHSFAGFYEPRDAEGADLFLRFDNGPAIPTRCPG